MQTNHPDSKISPGEWRLVITPPASGAWNMAVDEAILEATVQHAIPPTLRLYAWTPPCLSLGYAQPSADADLHRLSEYGWEIVRRPTGGRAILHTDELTYAVIGPEDDPRLVGSVLESYQRLSYFLLAALQSLGIAAKAIPEPTLPAGSDTKGPVCFEVPSNYEITVNGIKLVGSAQARRMKGVLQHGTLPLYGDLTRITQVLTFADENERLQAVKRLVTRAATVEEILGRTIDWNDVAQAFANAFERTLNIHLMNGNLTPDEQARAEQLVNEKYANRGWNFRL